MTSDDEITRAVEVLRAGGLVAFPTETVYGLGCDAENRPALRRLYAVKQRPTGHPVIVHLADAGALVEWASEVPGDARTLADACWPGPLTLVLQRSARVPDEVTGGHDTVAVRVPDQKVALSLLREFGGGIAAPSANRFGRVSPTTADDVRHDLGDDVDLVLDDGPCRVGVESTIVDCSGSAPAILRLGGVTRERVEELVGPVELRVRGEAPAPGTTPSHYAPEASVELIDPGAAGDRAQGLMARGVRVGLLALEALPTPPEGLVILDRPVDVEDYARVLYARLREADRLALEVLLAVPPTSAGIGAAVTDRLERAAAGAAVSATP